MMKLIGVVTAALLVLAPSLPAQDTLGDPVRLGQLRRQIEERFADRLREELGLTPDQSTRLRVSLAGLAARRRSREQEERGMRQALAAQLRPGIAADADSVARLVDGLTNLRVAYAQTFKDEMAELTSILTPIQRGQYLLLRDRLMQRVADLQQGRAEQPLPLRARRRP